MVNLSRTALISLKKLPTLEALEKLTSSAGGGETGKTVVEEPVLKGGGE